MQLIPLLLFLNIGIIMCKKIKDPRIESYDKQIEALGNRVKELEAELYYHYKNRCEYLENVLKQNGIDYE